MSLYMLERLLEVLSKWTLTIEKPVSALPRWNVWLRRNP